MLSLSYTISPQLKDSLDKIEFLRKSILSTPLSHANRLRFVWDAKVNRVYYSLLLSGQQISKTLVSKTMSSYSKKRMDDQEEEIINYKNSLDYIDRVWYVSDRQINSKDIIKLYEKLISSRVTKAQMGLFRGADKSISYFLDYLQSYPESPIIQAAIAQAEIFDTTSFLSHNDRLARLVSVMFLYKYGYDFGGMLNLEEKWFLDRVKYDAMINMVVKGQKITPWLEYFIDTALFQSEKTLQNIVKTKFNRDVSDSFWKLNDRQKQIANLLDQPGSSITNRSVQKKFRISQITASRDLSKMASLGLLFPHGKGRSVYYTRAV